MDIVLRVVVIYGFVFVGMKIVGKREFGQLSPMELVALLMIPEIVSTALNRNDPSLLDALAGAATLFLLVLVVSIISHSSTRLENFMEGKPTVLVQHGNLIVESMNRERVSPDEITGEMHKAGLYDLRQVRWAILESDGRIAIVPEDGPNVTQRSRALSDGLR
jgi:uncharacterized membrane protein YcaP (DUF421 family)